MFNKPPFLNIEIIKSYPREAVKFAESYFKGRKIIACEIGVWYGRNSKVMNKHLNIGRFYLIDNYVDEESKTGESYGGTIEVEKAKSYAHKSNKKGNEIWIRKASEDAVEDVDMLDFLYIDGNHKYEYIKKDLELYYPKIVEGGIISGHDIQAEGVSKALLEFAYKNKLQIHFGDRRDWWIIKDKRR